MEKAALAALSDLRMGLQQEREGEFPHSVDFYKWSEAAIRRAEEAVKRALLQHT